MNQPPLPSETLDNPNAIEELFCKEFEKAELFELDQDAFEITQKLLADGPYTDSHLNEKDKSQVMRLIQLRLPVSFTFFIKDFRAVIFLTMVAESPGNAIMYLTYIQYWLHKHGFEKEVTLEILCHDIFPNGFPSKKFLNELWYKLKVTHPNGNNIVNLLDCAKASLSIQFEDLTKVHP